ncbi:ribosome biogenesis protein SLX9 homolog isoform X3 [Bos taurus]|uniref:ribosome biogenesis protein SLX9 homolog isoform X3 n=1 Tax=Bos taurus TaxID=9913 RepID=UPI0007603143|nr:ribosome biogenesis protein SLX9 homolog isoform X3 [Bos taurus]
MRGRTRNLPPRLLEICAKKVNIPLRRSCAPRKGKGIPRIKEKRKSKLKRSCCTLELFPPGPPSPASTVPSALPALSSRSSLPVSELACLNADVFAGTTIDPSALVQQLDVETRSVTSIRRGAEAKTVLPKKEKLKLRRERWLQKIEAIKLAEQKLKAERRRRATVVVGDLQPLRDALPELLELEAGGRRPPTRRSFLPCRICSLPSQPRALCRLWPPVETRMCATLTPFSVSPAGRPADPGPPS